MAAAVIVKANVVEQVGFRLLVGGLARQLHLLGFQRTEEVLHCSVSAVTHQAEAVLSGTFAGNR